MITALAVIVHGQYVGTVRRSGDFTVMRLRPDLGPSALTDEALIFIATAQRNIELANARREV